MNRGTSLWLLVVTLAELACSSTSYGRRASGGAAGEGGLLDPSSGGSSPLAGAPGVNETGGSVNGSGGFVNAGGQMPASGGQDAAGGAPTGQGGTESTGPCSGVCEPTVGSDGASLGFDSLGRAVLRFGSAASCYPLTPEALGYSIRAWNCQMVPASRELRLNGSLVTACSGVTSPVSPSPQQPALRNGVYCFQVTAGSGEPALAFL